MRNFEVFFIMQHSESIFLVVLLIRLFLQGNLVSRSEQINEREG